MTSVAPSGKDPKKPKTNGDTCNHVTISSTDHTTTTTPSSVSTARQILSKIPLIGRNRSSHKSGHGLRPSIRWTNPRGKPSPNNGSNKDQETTPLLPGPSLIPRKDQEPGGDAGLDGQVSQQHRESQQPGRDPWKILKDRIDHGDMLLAGVGSEGLDDRVSQVHTRHEHELQKAIDEIRKGMEFNLSHCLLAIGLYLAISVICFNTIFEPEWTILDSCYFAMVTVSTVGYGDEVPTSPASIVFTCIYSCLGIAILGLALGILGTKLVDAQHAMASKAEKLLKFQVLSVFDPISHIRGPRNVPLVEEDEELDCHHQHQHQHYIQEEIKESLHKPSLFRSVLFCLKGVLPLVCLMLAMAYWIGHQAGWTFLEIIYFMIVTATTVGYGDFTPQTDQEKLIALLFIPIAVGATGAWLGGVANVIVESHCARYRRDLCMKELTQRDLDIMDSNKDGRVDRAEFLEFMLVAMNKIDQSLVEELRAHFDRLDVDGTGELTRDDLIEVARKKLKSPTHKLQLAMYKKHLLEQSPRGTGGLAGVRLFGTEWGSRRGDL